MKTFFSFVAVLMTVSLFAQTPGQPKNVEEGAIRKILNDQTLAWNRGDLNGFMIGYWEHDSLMFIGKSGITYGWNNTLNNYKKNYADPEAMGTLNFDLLEIKKLSGSYYHVTGKWHLKRVVGDVSGFFTLLFRKISGRWVIISDHSS